MENSRQYMECVINKQKNIQEMEKTAKDKLLFMQLSSARNPNFSLTQSTVKFIEEYGLNMGEMLTVSGDLSNSNTIKDSSWFLYFLDIKTEIFS